MTNKTYVAIIDDALVSFSTSLLELSAMAGAIAEGFGGDSGSCQIAEATQELSDELKAYGEPVDGFAWLRTGQVGTWSQGISERSQSPSPDGWTHTNGVDTHEHSYHA